MAEATKQKICVTFLDWEKAFDKVDQTKLVDALRRMSIPEIYIKAIESIYNAPEFRVKIGSDESSWRVQETGIRQGCPLSPYLFIILMTVMFKDVHEGLNLKKGTIEDLDFTEILYADDTILLTNNARSMNRLLERVETKES